VSSVTDVVKAAIAALPKFLGDETPQDLRVEEVEPPEEPGTEWRVTLSYLEPAPPKDQQHFVMDAIMRRKSFERVLRVIVIDERTLQAKRMKIRE
jgi:hypothetical protein